MEMIFSHTNGQLKLDFSIKTFYIDDCSDILYVGPLEDKSMNKAYAKYKKFDEAYELIRENDACLMSAKEVAKYRVMFGKKSLLSAIGAYTKEGMLSATKDETAMIWLKNSILTSSSAILSRAVDANASSREYYPKRLDDYLSNLAEGKDYFVVSDFKPINLQAHGTDKKTEFLFGNEADNYFKFIVDNTNVREISIHRTPKMGSTFAKPTERFATQMYLSSIPQHGSDMMFIGEIVGHAHKHFPVFGIRLEKEYKDYSASLSDKNETNYVFSNKLF